MAWVKERYGLRGKEIWSRLQAQKLRSGRKTSEPSSDRRQRLIANVILCRQNIIKKFIYNKIIEIKSNFVSGFRQHTPE